jgi:hypothetical protein
MGSSALLPQATSATTSNASERHRAVERARRLGLKKPSYNEGVATDIETAQDRASSDEDTVSWLAPLGLFTTACWPAGVPGHHRDTSAHGHERYAIRGMLRAAETFAGAAWDLASQPALLYRVRHEFHKVTRGFRFDALVPRGQRPPRRT